MRSRRFLAMAIAVGLAAAGCGEDTPGGPNARSAAFPTAPAVPAPDPEGEAEVPIPPEPEPNPDARTGAPVAIGEAPERAPTPSVSAPDEEAPPAP